MTKEERKQMTDELIRMLERLEELSITKHDSRLNEKHNSKIYNGAG